MLMTLDNLKNAKSAWNNDFAAYKRYISIRSLTRAHIHCNSHSARSNLKSLDPSEIIDSQTLYLFLANQNSILLSLRKRIESIEARLEILAFLVCDSRHR